MREQWGSQKIKRGRGNGTILDLGFDFKGATTDCLKKCATLVGVGLYLTRKDEAPQRQQRRQPQQQRQGQVDGQRAAAGALPPAQPAEPKKFNCGECGAELVKTEIDGRSWEPYQLANHGLSQFRKVLCVNHLQIATDAAKPKAS
jgi:hypothetical protein